MLRSPTEIDKNWDPYLDKEWIRKLDETPFLTRCRDKTVTLEELRRYLSQQYFYSRNFTRFLCALLSNLTHEEDRQDLTDNLIEESGLGQDRGTPHSVLYRQMLERMGVDVSEYSMHEDTARLVEVMLESCRSANYAVGLGALCLGAEAIVPHLYSQIVIGFQAHGFTEKDLDFFYLHISCDDAHAETMKKIIDREVKDTEKKLYVECSAKRAIAARVRFFESLSNPIAAGEGIYA